MALRHTPLLKYLLPVSLIACALALFALAAPQGSARHASQSFSLDLLLTGGQVIDGTGAPPRFADVGISGDRIVFLGNAAKRKIDAARTINARGLVVAPGFIDPHTHSGGDLADPKRNSNLNYLMQGVTTVIVGNDGDGTPHPLPTFARWEQLGIGTNAALLVGHGAVRREVLGNDDVQPTPEQLDKMKSLVRRAMDDGSIGLSTGLFYVPGSFSRTEEVIELARAAAERGGYYDSHMRDENSYGIGLLGSIDETIRIGREAKIPVHISHIKALGPDVWGKSVEAIARIERARAEAIDVTADQYPYSASGSALTASLLPAWAQAGRREEILARLADPGTHARLLAEMEENLKRRGGPDSLLFTSSLAPELLGKTLAAVAREKELPPVEAALAIMLERKLNGLAVASFNMNEDDIVRFMRQPWVMTGSDGSQGHPRLYGTFPRKLRGYVFQKKVLTLPAAIRVSSSLPAHLAHFAQRGELREGFFADVIAFDPATFADRATYEHPDLLAVGMKYVIVNGQLAIEDGKYTGALAGRALRRK
jgi:N-acyl-D-amino-acid deacylase